VSRGKVESIIRPVRQWNLAALAIGEAEAGNHEEEDLTQSRKEQKSEGAGQHPRFPSLGVWFLSSFCLLCAFA
jgi:hypothetical protein